MRNRIIPYKKGLKEKARALRKNSTLAEVLLWKQIKGKALGYEFHRQVPIDNFILDFYCHELTLAVEIDGDSHNNKSKYDASREEKLKLIGVNFLRFYDSDVKRNMTGILETLNDRIKNIQNKNIPHYPPSKGDA